MITNIINIIVYTTPLLLTALSFNITARGGLFNLGVEGYFILSSLSACVIGIIFSSLPHILLTPFCIICAIITTVIISTIIYILKCKYNINEIFIMIIFNYIALHFSNFVININILKSTGGAETTKRVGSNALMTLAPALIKTFHLPHSANFTISIALSLCVLFALYFKYSAVGHNIENIRFNKEAAMLSGINIKKTLYKAELMSAIVSGLAGSLYVLSIGKRISMLPTFEGYGFTGILIALFANQNTMMLIPASFLFGTLKYMGRYLNIINLPSQIIDLIISFVVLITAIFINIKKRRSK